MDTTTSEPRSTMIDVARAAGVSLKTVSRVINREPGVSPTTAQKVLAASSALRYERNDLAASLRRGVRSFSVGLVIEDVANPFYSTIVQAVEEVARERDCLVITGSAREDADRERELVIALLRRRVDALLLVPTSNDHRYIAEAGFNTKIVFVDRPPAKIKADTVLIENAKGAQRGVEQLISRGHSRIAFVGDEVRLYTARERLIGYRRALAASGLPVPEDLVITGNSSSSDAAAAVSELMALPAGRRPTALFTGNNRCTVGALHALGRRRKRVGLVGFDEFELADLLDVSLVRTDPYRMGHLAAELAFRRINGDSRKPQRVVVPTELIIRGSDAVPLST